MPTYRRLSNNELPAGLVSIATRIGNWNAPGFVDTWALGRHCPIGREGCATIPRGSNFQKPYPPGFRREAVALYRRSGRPLTEIASDLGVSTETLRIWTRQAAVDAGVRGGLSTEEHEELRREVRVLGEEREILKKAAAFFAKEGESR